MQIIPDTPGTYILILKVLSSRTVKAGMLGKVNLAPGFFAYVGSALGVGGLRARTRRHIISDKKPCWHIDYIRPYAFINEIWFCSVKKRLEHTAAMVIQSLPETVIAADNFGSSDCRCSSHLFRFDGKPSFKKFRKAFKVQSGEERWEFAMPATRPRILVSKCLAGHNCRYNGETIKYDMVDRLGIIADLIEVCPEMEIGLSVPRRPVNIIISEGQKKLIQSDTGEDLTGSMAEFSSHFIHSNAPVSGFIMKGRSPSCGIGNTPVYGPDISYGSGFFASAFMGKYPDTPAANIEDLQGRKVLEDFLAAVLNESSKMRNAGLGVSNDPLVQIWNRENSSLMGRYLLVVPSD